MDTSTLLLHERLLLLVLDEQNGTSRSSYAEPALAGAVLLDLLRIGAVAPAADHLTVSAGAAAPAGVLGDAAKAVADELKPRGPRWWVDHLPGRMKPFLPRLAGRLIENGVLTQDQHKVLGMFATSRLPERDHAPEAEVRERLRAVLVGDIQPDTQDAILVGLLAALNLVGAVVDSDQRKQAHRRAQELGHGNEMGDAVGQAIKAAQDAVMAATIASTVAASSAATTVTTQQPTVSPSAGAASGGRDNSTGRRVDHRLAVDDHGRDGFVAAGYRTHERRGVGVLPDVDPPSGSRRIRNARRSRRQTRIRAASRSSPRPACSRSFVTPHIENGHVVHIVPLALSLFGL